LSGHVSAGAAEWLLILAGGNSYRRSVAWPLAVRAQQESVPTIGFLTSRTADQAGYLIAALRNGLKETGSIEGQNLAIEYRYAESQYDRLPALAATSWTAGSR
jgi:hypothetical protein